MDTNIHLFNSKLRRKQNNIDRLNNEIKNMKKDIEELKINMKFNYEKLDKENKNNKKEIDNLKLKLNQIEENLKCPITHCRINYPVITPSGITYEKSAIIRWLTYNHIDPSNRQPLSIEQLVDNIALKNIINVLKKNIK